MAHIYEALVHKLQLQTLNISYGIVRDVGGGGGEGGGAAERQLGERLAAAVEASRAHFAVGFPQWGVPPLEPVAVPHLAFFVHQRGIIRAPIDLYNVDVAGLGDFILDSLVFQLEDFTLRFDVNLPELVFNSRYVANGKVASVIPFKPKGSARVEMTNVTVKGIVNLKTVNGSLTIKAFQINLEVGKTKVNFTGLLGNGFVNKMLNWVLNRLSDRVVQAQKDQLANTVASEIMEVANGVLKNVTIMDLIG